jgi:hypothetical protein
MNKNCIQIGLVFVLSVMSGFPGFAQRPLPKDSHTKSSGTSAALNGLSFTYSSDLPKKFAKVQASGGAKVHLINKSDEYICLALINSDGNLQYGWTDGNAGLPVFFVTPGKRTNQARPYCPAVGQPFAILTAGGEVIGYGQISVEGEFDLTIE